MTRLPEPATETSMSTKPPIEDLLGGKSVDCPLREHPGLTPHPSKVSQDFLIEMDEVS